MNVYFLEHSFGESCEGNYIYIYMRASTKCILHTAYYKSSDGLGLGLVSDRYKMHTTYCILHTAYYILHTTYCILHTAYYKSSDGLGLGLVSDRYILHTTYYIL